MSNTVEGTFDDLPPEEKTRAFLQFLQYHQQQQQIKETEKFQQLYNADATGAGAQEDTYSQMDEKVVEESLKIWYGISNGAADSATRGVTQLITVVTIASLRNFCIWN